MGCGLALALAALGTAWPAEPIRHLFLDPALVAESSGVALQVNPPVSREVVLVPDKPWESMMISFYLTVMEDQGRLRMWYICRDRENRPNLAYAESTDGVTWTKPTLGLIDYNGNRDNNLVGIGNLEGTVVRDERAPPTERYVYITNVYSEGIFRFHSPDGLRWVRDASPLLRFESDTQNVMFHDRNIGRYVLYMRGWDPGTDTTRRRKVVRLELDDHSQSIPINPTGQRTHPASADPTRLPWIVGEIPTVLQVDRNDPPETDIYTISAQPYPVDPAWYVGFPSLYRHRPESDDPPFENDGRSEVHFVGSRDGRQWHRYDRRTYVAPVVPARGHMAYMGTGMIERGDEIWQYGTEFRTRHGEGAERRREKDGVIVRYVQRIDGFVSANTGATEGRLRTAPVRVRGDKIRLNVDVGALGSLRMALLDASGVPIPGFGFEEADELRVNSTGVVASWSGRSDLTTLIGRDVRLEFRSTQTRLFSFRFEPAQIASFQP
jgi:hypothetical protein